MARLVQSVHRSILLAVLAVGIACGGTGAGGGGTSACDEAEARLDRAQVELDVAQDSGDRDRLEAAIEERAAAAREYDAACP